MTLRSALPEDAAAMARLEQATQPKPWSEQVFKDELGGENRTYVVAEGEEGLVGFAGIMVVGDEAHVTNLLVAEGCRRQGVGRRLVARLTEASVGQGARHLTLEVRSQNRAARGLYASLGLAPVGVRPGYYGDDDALILWAHDIDGEEFRSRLP
ncbi:MAG: ribosomal protein S18-alanine N-acetyltransferase [Acidimicrobiia bacterium]